MRWMLILFLLAGLSGAAFCQETPATEGGKQGALQTGQSKSAAKFDDAWYAGRGVGRARAYVRNNDGTVTDPNTGLMWIADPSRCGKPFAAPGKVLRMTYTDAAKACEQLQFAGHDDWRLPTVEELATLIDAGRSYPSTNTDSIVCAPGQYWTTTPIAGGKSGRWIIGFSTGFVRTTTAEGSAKYVRPVRFADPKRQTAAVQAFQDNGDGTVTDPATGLMWLRDAEQAGLTARRPWSEAIKVCEQLQYAGHDDWRLPSRNELQSLIDYARTKPAANSMFFVLRPELYWSSTSHAENPGSWAWAVGFDDGSVDSGDKAIPLLAQPVRTK